MGEFVLDVDDNLFVVNMRNIEASEISATVLDVVISEVFIYIIVIIFFFLSLNLELCILRLSE